MPYFSFLTNISWRTDDAEGSSGERILFYSLCTTTAPVSTRNKQDCVIFPPCQAIQYDTFTDEFAGRAGREKKIFLETELPHCSARRTYQCAMLRDW
jgi:hypothetical protein